MNSSRSRLVVGGSVSLIFLGAVAALKGCAAQEDESTMTSNRRLSADRIVFSSTPPGQTPQGAEMRKRLSDPALRAELRAETFEQVRSWNPEMAEVLGLDPELEAVLFEVLTDEQMAILERFYREEPRMLTSQEGRDPAQNMMRLADEETRAKQKIRDVLGEKRFELYVGYMDSLGERRRVVFFEERLEQRLAPDQRERLMALLRAEQDRWHARRRSESHLKPGPTASDASPESRQKRHAASNEDLYRQMLEDSRALLARLPAILTPKQLDAYAQMEASVLASQKAYVQELRASAGLTPEFDETQLRTLPAKRTPVAGKVRLAITLTIDAHAPVKAAVITENGKTPPAFRCPEGLWIEATPTLYEDGWAQVDYAYYEERGGKRIRLTDSGSSGIMTRRPDGAPWRGGGGGATTLNGGRKSFAIGEWIEVTPAE